MSANAGWDSIVEKWTEQIYSMRLRALEHGADEKSLVLLYVDEQRQAPYAPKYLGTFFNIPVFTWGFVSRMRYRWLLLDLSEPSLTEGAVAIGETYKIEFADAMDLIYNFIDRIDGTNVKKLNITTTRMLEIFYIVASIKSGDTQELPKLDVEDPVDDRLDVALPDNYYHFLSRQLYVGGEPESDVIRFTTTTKEQSNAQPEPASWVSQVKGITDGARRENYGRPLINFLRIAVFWSDYLQGVKITPVQVAVMMMLLKFGRSMHSWHEDNWLDTLGYTDCIDDMDRQMRELGYENGAASFEDMTMGEIRGLIIRLT